MPRSRRPRKSTRVGLGVELFERGDRLGPSREEREHGADPLNAAERRKPRLEARAAPLELVVDLGVAQAPQHRQPGGGRQRVAAERARLVDVARRREPLEHVAATAERGERQAAAGDLAEDRQVGIHAVAPPARRRGRRGSR